MSGGIASPWTEHSTWSPGESWRKPLGINCSLVGREEEDINMGETLDDFQRG